MKHFSHLDHIHRCQLEKLPKNGHKLAFFENLLKNCSLEECYQYNHYPVIIIFQQHSLRSSKRNTFIENFRLFEQHLSQNQSVKSDQNKKQQLLCSVKSDLEISKNGTFLKKQDFLEHSKAKQQCVSRPLIQSVGLKQLEQNQLYF